MYTFVFFDVSNKKPWKIVICHENLNTNTGIIWWG